ncbi:HisA/HisF-related TIM barrel protein [Elusimicrobiota bacterium]
MPFEFAGIKLNNPCISASGCYGYGWEAENNFPGLNWGGITTKTITVEKREGNPPPRIFETPAGLINRIGLQNCGLTDFINNELPLIKTLPYPAIISIFGNNTKEWLQLVTILNDKEVPAFELNLSCPNIKGKRLVEDIGGCADLVKELKRSTKTPIIAKINAMDDPFALTVELKKSGVNGIVCSNTLPASVIHQGKIFNGGLSGSAIKPVVLKTIAEIKENIDIAVAACGGIASLKDIEDYKAAGADVFVLGSILLIQPDIINEILDKGDHK